MPLWLKKIFLRSQSSWNSLPDSVISANNVNTFKSRLDKFWANQKLIFDYKSSLTGTGNRRTFRWQFWYYRFLVSLFHIHLMGIEASAFTRFLQLCFALLCFYTVKHIKQPIFVALYIDKLLFSQFCTLWIWIILKHFFQKSHYIHISFILLTIFLRFFVNILNRVWITSFHTSCSFWTGSRTVYLLSRCY